MSFTDRFLEIEVLMYSEQEDNLYNRSEKERKLIPCKRLINPMRIESIGESIPDSDFREDNKIWTRVTMYSNDDFVCPINFSDFKNLLNSHQK